MFKPEPTRRCTPTWGKKFGYVKKDRVGFSQSSELSEGGGLGVEHITDQYQLILKQMQRRETKRAQAGKQALDPNGLEAAWVFHACAAEAVRSRSRRTPRGRRKKRKTSTASAARRSGAAVIGICGTDAKVDALLDLGFSSALNYKSGTLAADLDAALDGREVTHYFDNVGGEVLDAVLAAALPGSLHGSLHGASAGGEYTVTLIPPRIGWYVVAFLYNGHLVPQTNQSLRPVCPHGQAPLADGTCGCAVGSACDPTRGVLRFCWRAPQVLDQNQCS